MAKRKCKKHPKYQGLRRPRAKDENGELCADCVAIFEEARAAGLKETRAPRQRKEKPEEVETPVVAEAAVEEVVEPEVEAPEPEVEEEEESCDECPDDDDLDGLLEDTDWDFDDDDEDEEI